MVELLPGTMKVADMVADNPGQWLFHCHVAEIMANGMFARVTVFPTNTPGVSRAPEKAFFGLPYRGERGSKNGRDRERNSSIALDIRAFLCALLPWQKPAPDQRAHPLFTRWLPVWC